jgi:hypothetical protein
MAFLPNSNKNNSDCAPSTCQGKFKPASYAECMALGNKRSWDPNTAWLYCSNQGTRTDRYDDKNAVDAALEKRSRHRQRPRR